MPTSSNPGCLAFFLNLFRAKNKSLYDVTYLPGDGQPEVFSFPFRVRDDFLSPAEQSFYHVLRTTLGEDFTVCPKVGLAEIFFVVRPNENMNAYNRINRKHVDYLVANAKTLKPVLGIELDDSSHNRPDRIERDEFVDGVFKAADLPLLHISTKATYNTSELQVLIQRALPKKRDPNTEPVSAEKTVPPVSPAPVSETPPLCPKCGVPMVLRTARNGDQPGRQFYGCKNYPRCRVVVSLPKAEGA